MYDSYANNGEQSEMTLKNESSDSMLMTSASHPSRSASQTQSKLLGPQGSTFMNESHADVIATVVSEVSTTTNAANLAHLTDAEAEAERLSAANFLEVFKY